MALLRTCACNGCTNLFPPGKSFCEEHEHLAQELHKRKPGSIDTVERALAKDLYNSRRWADLRGSVLREQPLCIRCRQKGIRRAATVVDHIVSHRNDKELFFQRTNLQSLCKSCHDNKTLKEDAPESIKLQRKIQQEQRTKEALAKFDELFKL